jgi:exonuclease SbcC
LLSEQLTTVLPFIQYIEAKKKSANLSQRINEYTLLESQLDKEFSAVENRLEERISSFFYTDLINNIYSKIDPHPTFKKVEFKCIFPESDQPRLEVYLHEKNGSPISPNLYFSAAQLNILSLSIFLARALHVKHEGEFVETILIDDPIHSMDSINILSTIDLLRNLSIKFNRQIILSTHDENFYELLKMKIPSESFKSKFIKLESYGKVALAD